MTLTTHAIIGGALASAVPTHPILAFSLGFCSHFLLDAIPHYDYHLNSLSENENNFLDNDMKIGWDFVFDLFKIGLDFLLGFILVFLFFGMSHNFFYNSVLFWGAFGAVIPDAFHFIYFKFKHEPFISFEKFHLEIQHDLKENHLLGWSLQVVLIIVVVFLQKKFL